MSSCRKNSGLQTAKGISGGVQFVASQTAGWIADRYDKADPLPDKDSFGNKILSRKIFAKSLTNFLIGKVTWVLSAADTLTKINNGTVTKDDYLDFSHTTLTVVTAWAVASGLAAPAFAGAVALTGVFVFAARAYNHFTCDPLDGDDYQNLNRSDRVDIYDPLVIAIKDAIKVTAADGYDGALFDFDGNGLRTATSWIGEDTGLLVLDRNGDGIINDGSEFFGDYTVLTNSAETAEHGFAALQELDSNGDGQVNAEDALFEKIRVWLDKNADGVIDEGELLSLAELGIVGLNTDYKEVNKNLGGGNELTQLGSFVREDGTTGEMGDVNFKLDTMHTRFVDQIELTPEQIMLPDVVGSGNVRDLAQAAATSDALANILTAYAKAETKSEQMALLETLILEWAKTDVYGFSTATAITFAVPTTQVTNGTGGVRLTPGQLKGLAGFTLSPALQEKADSLIEKVNILDSFTGSKTSVVYVTSEKDVENFCNVVEKTYQSLLSTVYLKLSMKTRLEEYLFAIDAQIINDELILDYSGIERTFREVFAENPAKAFVDLSEFVQIYDWQDGKVLFTEWLTIAQEQGVADEYLALLGEGGFLLGYQELDGAGTLKGTAKNDILQGSDADDRLEAGNGDDVINAADGNDRIYGGKGSDTITGGRGNDRIEDGDGDDTVDAGDGNDYIEGGQGSDTYIFKGDFGKDSIYNYYSGAEDVDVIDIQGRNRDEFSFTRYGVAQECPRGIMASAAALRTRATPRAALGARRSDRQTTASRTPKVGSRARKMPLRSAGTSCRPRFHAQAASRLHPRPR